MSANNSTLQDLLQIKPQQNMSDRLYQQISKLIRDGKLKEGYLFPNETVLCEQLNVGRSTIREAYKALELSGYVTRSKRGTYVNNISAILGATPLKKVVVSSSETDFLDFRLMLEGKAAELAALRANEKEIGEMQEILDQFAEAKQADRQEALIICDRNFHEKIVSATRNMLMITAMTAVSELWETERLKNFFKASESNPALFDRVITMHQAILDAIRSHDEGTARRLMEEHIREVS